MMLQEINNRIEGVQWDYEPEYVPSYIETIEEEELNATKNPLNQHENSNKVVKMVIRSKQDWEEKFAKVEAFYGSIPFSLWLYQESNNYFAPFLSERGFKKTDEYEGLSYTLCPQSYHSNFQLKEVETEEDIQHLVEVTSVIWGYKNDIKEKVLQERKNYLSLPFRKGGYVLAYNNEGIPVGYGAYRVSSDLQSIYFTGSGVHPSYRKQGVYNSLVYYRLNKAFHAGVKYATCQARIGHSSPILQKLGFKKYSHYERWIKG
ncbi:GNAT family N-acetyltransferase [Bacillus spongiae]|uniref:GNAT family N-acetyltransferase n=1 Tax=Bacillus spongiae TaxID=2683610 RepID=A0ABU8HIA6_9BACI